MKRTAVVSTTGPRFVLFLMFATVDGALCLHTEPFKFVLLPLFSCFFAPATWSALSFGGVHSTPVWIWRSCGMVESALAGYLIGRLLNPHQTRWRRPFVTSSTGIGVFIVADVWARSDPWLGVTREVVSQPLAAWAGNLGVEFDYGTAVGWNVLTLMGFLTLLATLQLGVWLLFLRFLRYAKDIGERHWETCSKSLPR